MSNLFFGTWGQDVPVASCMSQAENSCSCDTGSVKRSGPLKDHLICGCGNDHGIYQGPNTQRMPWHW